MMMDLRSYIQDTLKSAKNIYKPLQGVLHQAADTYAQGPKMLPNEEAMGLVMGMAGAPKGAVMAAEEAGPAISQYGVRMAANDANSVYDAVRTLSGKPDINQYMSGGINRAEQTIRELAGDYIDKGMAKSSPIDELIQLLQERIKLDHNIK